MSNTGFSVSFTFTQLSSYTNECLGCMLLISREFLHCWLAGGAAAAVAHTTHMPGACQGFFYPQVKAIFLI